jgi:hypothetical protein
MSLSSFLAWLIPPAVTPQAIRSEIYFLGSRHHGEALSGALEELKSSDRGAGRSRLLRAVIDELRREQR